MSPYTTNNVYREIFDEFYDLSHASIYKLQTRLSGVVFIGLLPNIYFTSMFIDNVEKGGLSIQNKPISLRLFGKRSFTLCVVMQLYHQSSSVVFVEVVVHSQFQHDESSVLVVISTHVDCQVICYHT